MTLAGRPVDSRRSFPPSLRIRPPASRLQLGKRQAATAVTLAVLPTLGKRVLVGARPVAVECPERGEVGLATRAVVLRCSAATDTTLRPSSPCAATDLFAFPIESPRGRENATSEAPAGTSGSREWLVHAARCDALSASAGFPGASASRSRRHVQACGSRHTTQSPAGSHQQRSHGVSIRTPLAPSLVLGPSTTSSFYRRSMALRVSGPSSTSAFHASAACSRSACFDQSQEARRLGARAVRHK
jgi:hypothetical protein